MEVTGIIQKEINPLVSVKTGGKKMENIFYATTFWSHDCGDDVILKSSIEDDNDGKTLLRLYKDFLLFKTEGKQIKITEEENKLTIEIL
jgi:hypothetical protein